MTPAPELIVVVPTTAMGAIIQLLVAVTVIRILRSATSGSESLCIC